MDKEKIKKQAKKIIEECERVERIEKAIKKIKRKKRNRPRINAIKIKREHGEIYIGNKNDYGGSVSEESLVEIEDKILEVLEKELNNQ